MTRLIPSPAPRQITQTVPEASDVSVEPLMIVADPDQPRLQVGQRDITEVAVGILLKEEGGFLMTSRPAGKAYAGHWEFPGGKIESGETVDEALRRELFEELGITIRGVYPWRVLCIDYPHTFVRLHFCKVYDWSGELQMREGQTFAWQHSPVQVKPILAGTLPVLQWLAKV